MPTTHLDPTQAGAQITRDNFHWGTTLGAPAGPITFGFRQTSTSNNTTTEKNTFSQFTAQEMAAAETGIHEWAAVANITFSEVNPSSYTNSATILFGNYFSSSDGAQAYTYFPSSNNQTATNAQGDVWLNTAYEHTSSLPFGGYDFLTVIHEIGHALGLEHPGDYDAGPGQTITYANSAQYIEDTRQYTVMSYFAASNTGANFVYNGQTIYPSTPLLDDITAIQRLYGANMSYATGNTVYGFNSNADSAYHLNSATQQVVCCIWDAGGNDTLDFSGYSTNQLIDLVPGTFSNVGALTMNVSIALGTVVEDAIGGSGNDTFYGNSANNTIDGGGGSDTVIFTGAHNQYLVTLGSDGSIQLADLRAGAPDGTDTLLNVEFLQFTDGLYSAGQLEALAAPVATGITGHTQGTANQVTGANFFGPGGGGGDFFLIADHNDTRTLEAWQIDNSTVTTAVTFGSVGLEQHFDGAGDFNHDGLSDLLLNVTNGGTQTLYIDSMSPTGVQGQFNLGSLGADWIVDAIADFTGDGTADILLHRDAGGVRLGEVIKVVNNVVQSAPTFGPTATDIVTIGAGDFNHDGTADILQQQLNPAAGTLTLRVLTMANGIVKGATTLGAVGENWQVDGIGDFNHDGTADILLHLDTSNNQRTFEILSIVNNAVSAATIIGSVGTNISVDGIGDFNGDGTADIALHADTGTTRDHLIYNIVDNVVVTPHSIGMTGADWLVS